MKLETIVFNETSFMEGDKYCVILLIPKLENSPTCIDVYIIAVTTATED